MKALKFSTIAVLLLIIIVVKAPAQGWKPALELEKTITNIARGAALARAVNSVLKEPKLPNDWRARTIDEKAKYLLWHDPCFVLLKNDRAEALIKADMIRIGGQWFPAKPFAVKLQRSIIVEPNKGW